MPFVVNVNNLTIYDSLYLCIENNDQGILIITAFKLVLMNAIRILPVYMATYTLVMFLKQRFRGRYSILYQIAGLMAVPFSYVFIKVVLHVQYDFSLTSFAMMVTIFGWVQGDFLRIKLVKKAVFVILLLIGLQWVDVIPTLSKFGFGSGEVSYDIKLAVQFMNAEDAVTLSAILFTTIFIGSALMVMKLLRDQNTIIETMASKSRMEIELRNIRLKALRTQSWQEQQSLVHDFKNHFMVIQELASLAELRSHDEKVKAYMMKINASVGQINDMISEMLFASNRHRTTIDSLLKSIWAHMPPSVDEGVLSCENLLAGATLVINKVSFTRLFINLIENSSEALRENGRIEIRLYEEGMYLVFAVWDNGVGIPPELLPEIKASGFSTKGSSGIGLRYVEDVVLRHCGTFDIVSKGALGTQAIVKLDKEYVNYEKNPCN